MIGVADTPTEYISLAPALAGRSESAAAVAAEVPPSTGQVIEVTGWWPRPDRLRAADGGKNALCCIAGVGWYDIVQGSLVSLGCPDRGWWPALISDGLVWSCETASKQRPERVERAQPSTERAADGWWVRYLSHPTAPAPLPRGHATAAVMSNTKKDE